MKSGDLKQIFKEIHEIFPLPVSENFKGRHAISINEKGNVELGLWVDTPEGIKNFPLISDGDEDVINLDALKTAKKQVEDIVQSMKVKIINPDWDNYEVVN